jgi:DNA end-binding protein Ku
MKLKQVSVDEAGDTVDEPVTGYKNLKGEYVVLSKDQLGSILSEKDRTLSIDKFVPAVEIDPRAYQKSYILHPEEGGEKAYGVIVKAIESRNVVAIVTFVWRSKSVLAAIRSHDGRLLLSQLSFYTEMVDMRNDLYYEAPEATEQEASLAGMLIDGMTGTFDHDDYEDEYTKRLRNLIETGEGIAQGEMEAEEAVDDLLEGLKASLNATE